MNKCKILLISAALAFSQQAFAYIDPGSFSLLIQSIIAILASLLGFFAIFWKKIKNVISKIFKWKK